MSLLVHLWHFFFKLAIQLFLLFTASSLKFGYKWFFWQNFFFLLLFSLFCLCLKFLFLLSFCSLISCLLSTICISASCLISRAVFHCFLGRGSLFFFLFLLLLSLLHKLLPPCLKLRWEWVEGLLGSVKGWTFIITSRFWCSWFLYFFIIRFKQILKTFIFSRSFFSTQKVF